MKIPKERAIFFHRSLYSLLSKHPIDALYKEVTSSPVSRGGRVMHACMLLPSRTWRFCLHFLFLDLYLKLQSLCSSFSAQAFSQNLSEVIVGKDDMDHAGQGTNNQSQSAVAKQLSPIREIHSPEQHPAALGQLWDFYWILLLVKIQRQQLHMLPLFSEWARIKGAALKQTICVPHLSGYL